MCVDMGISEVIEWMWRLESGEKVYERMQEGMNEWKEKQRENDWKKMRNSTYNEIYKEMIPGEKGAGYFDIRRKNRDENITWARMRCGNVGRANKKGYKDWGCRLCNRESETLQHLIICDEGGKNQEENVKRKMRE